MEVDSREISASEVRRLVDQRLQHLVDVREPLVLISHEGRSGGTLVNQLLDAHPAVHSHPYELEIQRGEPGWPAFDLDGDPREWLARISERHVPRSFETGYTKGTGRDVGLEDERFPFLLPPALQEMLFVELVARAPVKTQRDVFDRYFASYFNAWLDNQNLYGGAKRWIVAHRASLARSREAREGFFETYPDGRLIAPVRDPKGWYASSRRLYPERTADLDAALGAWRNAVDQTLDAVRTHPARVLVVPYESLVLHTPGVMRKVAKWLGIDARASLSEPTFNGMPIRPNSSFPIAGHGVRHEPLTAWESELTRAERDRIDALAGEAYRTVVGSTAAVTP
jgi:hypothetical protein